jgi:hypothetical protein
LESEISYVEKKMIAYINGTEVIALIKSDLPQPEGLEFTSAANIIDGQRVEVGDSCIDGVFTSYRTSLPSKCLTKLEFINRFTLQELGAIEVSTDPIVKVLQRQQGLAEFIDLKDPNTIQGIGYLAQIGLITNSRMMEILT